LTKYIFSVYYGKAQGVLSSREKLFVCNIFKKERGGTMSFLKQLWALLLPMISFLAETVLTGMKFLWPYVTKGGLYALEKGRNHFRNHPMQGVYVVGLAVFIFLGPLDKSGWVTGLCIIAAIVHIASLLLKGGRLTGEKLTGKKKS